MAKSKKNCNPPKKVSKAASTLSTSKSATEKSKAGTILQQHQAKNH